MSSLKAKLNKHARSRFVKSAKGAKVLEESLGEDVTNFLNVINDMVRKHYGEKVREREFVFYSWLSLSKHFQLWFAISFFFFMFSFQL